MVRYNQAQTIDNLNDQLFTEISSEQAAVIEGGLQVLLTSIRSIRSVADGVGGTDDLFIRYGRNGDANAVNGPDLTFARPKGMKTGNFANISTGSSRSGAVDVELFDKDGSSRQLIGRFSISRAGRGTRTVSAANGSFGSIYEITFNAF
ncbi:MAG: hypothetical protein KME07_03885 [Pegethrix bostrychoides GSE-TBD4-15B]|jgi:hypothetical protein|uniref:Uncharacterized protein n=1 Tax=Pegethrix bostrychoides GSE-TBD4-15B TaxID=2839662 RepID=A0A951P8E9_9CYAN|nr:hypothetical protein [Pegethrix bostrychoides GSE-TBD4-15B]